MSRHVGSSELAAVALQMGARLSHTEFRVLMLVSECPDGPRWKASVDYLARQGRLHPADIRDAVNVLKFLRDCPVRVFGGDQFVIVEPNDE